MSMSICEGELEMIKELSKLLKENGERVLHGQSMLSLSSRCLQILNECFSNFTDTDFNSSFEVLPPNSPRFPIYDDLQFLFDLIQKTIGLKIIHGSGTIQGRVSIASFKSLDDLVLKKTPLHLLQGLQKLRGRLRSIICTKCLTTLSELLETCGGDMSSGLSWPHLKAVDLSYNTLQCLDNSLRLLSCIEHLNLSHNMIQETSSYLEYLEGIIFLDLSYNVIQTFPSLNRTAKTSSLQTLVLRNNNLESLSGLQDCLYLRELDLGNNCLVSHCTLVVLKKLVRLVLVRLDGNPLSFHPKHRCLSISYLPPQTYGKVILDGKLVKIKEAELALRKHKNLLQPGSELNQNESFPQQSVPTGSSQARTSESARPLLASNASSHSITSLERSLTVDEESAASSGAGRRKMRKKARRSVAKRPLIESITGEELEDNTSLSDRVPTPSSSYHEQKATIEQVRNQLGPAWIHSLPNLQPNQNTPSRELDQHGSNMKQGNNITSKEDDTAVLDLGSNEIANNNSCQSKQKLIDDVAQTVDKHGHESNQEDGLEFRVTPEVTRTLEDFIDVSPAECDREVNVESNACEDKNSTKEKPSNQENGGEPPRQTCLTNDDEFSIWPSEKTDVTNEHLDYGEEGDPFLVTLTDSSQQQLMVTIAERHILEKDFNGQVIEALGLKSLCSIRRVQGRSLNDKSEKNDSADEDAPILHLCFDYIKKNKRNRKYHMESVQEADAFMELLQPIISAKSQISKDDNIMECLRCNIKFPKRRAITKVRSTSISDIDSAGGSVERDYLEETLSCPRCQSDRMLIEHEETSSNISTPVGSLGKTHIRSKSSGSQQSFDGAFEPMATSSTNPSPWKSNDERADTASTHAVVNLFSTATSSEEKSSSGRDSLRRNIRDRHESVDSDIVVLSQQPNSKTDKMKTSPSPMLARLLVPQDVHHSDSDYEYDEGINIKFRSGSCPSKDITPCGSLNDKTVNSMISSVYEATQLPEQDPPSVDMTSSTDSLAVINQVESGEALHSSAGMPADEASSIYKDSDELSLNGSDSATPQASPLHQQSHTTRDMGVVRFWYDDFSQVDHKLKLYFTMQVFQDDDEDFALLLKCSILHNSLPDDFKGLLVVSTSKCYILKFVDDSAEQPEDIFKIIAEYLLTELLYVDIGLGYQSFRLDFGSASACYDFIIREEVWCKKFMRQFTALLGKTAFSSHGKLEGISKSNPETMHNLLCQVLLPEAPDSDSTASLDSVNNSEIDTNLSKYILCYQRTGEVNDEGGFTLDPVSIAVTPTYICLAKEDLHLPTPRSSNSSHKSTAAGPQFQLKDRQRLTDVNQIDVKCDAMEMELHFIEESNMECSSWNIVMESNPMLNSLVEAIRSPWEEMFGVNLEVNYL